MRFTIYLANYLANAQIPVKEVYLSEEPQFEDDSIDIDSTTHVQVVNTDCFCIVQEHNGAFHYVKSCSTKRHLVNELRKLI
jgi:hypothetical protein